ncbi:MAG: hypothetical protein NVV74_17745 [Magnetospirillum sp.]|nr:hypothetical protein [Magnetospirillum sp.]
MSAVAEGVYGDERVVYGRCRGPVAAALTNLFLLICGAGMLALAAFLVGRGFRAYGDALDILIAVCVLVVLTSLVYITRSGTKVGYALVVAGPAIKVALKDHGLPVTQPYATIGAFTLIYALVYVLVSAIANLRRCVGVEVAVGPKGVYIRRVSDRWIPWSYVDKVEEFSRFGQPAFRLFLNSRVGLRCKFLWFISERHPTISTRAVAISPMVLREALHSRGRNFIP